MIKGTTGQIVEYKNGVHDGKYLLDDEYVEAPAQLTALRIDKLIEERKSPYQHIAIYESSFHGKVLVLDGFIQLTVADYFCYHEMIVHVPMAIIPDTPKSAWVVGGGDGAAVNELGKYRSLDRIVWVDIDADVVEVCRQHFPELHRYHDDRVEFIAMNGANIDFRNEFDLIIVDGTDFIGEGADLASKKFYTQLTAALKPGGMVTVLGWWAWPESDYHQLTRQRAQASFEQVYYYWFIDPSMKYGYMGIYLMTNSLVDPTVPKHFHRVPTELIRYYNEGVHSASFVLPTCFTTGAGFVSGKS
jgi:spermidine synthase